MVMHDLYTLQYFKQLSKNIFGQFVDNMVTGDNIG
jgi:hypothetical protein